jgi:hypothetical protein
MRGRLPDRRSLPVGGRGTGVRLGYNRILCNVPDSEKGVVVISLNSTVAASENQVSSDLGGEVVLLNLVSGVYYGLDAVGARVWELIQVPRGVQEIRDTLLEEYDVEPERWERDLLALLDRLADEGLIKVHENAHS